MAPPVQLQRVESTSGERFKSKRRVSLSTSLLVLRPHCSFSASELATFSSRTSGCAARSLLHPAPLHPALSHVLALDALLRPSPLPSLLPESVSYKWALCSSSSSTVHLHGTEVPRQLVEQQPPMPSIWPALSQRASCVRWPSGRGSGTAQRDR